MCAFAHPYAYLSIASPPMDAPQFCEPKAYETFFDQFALIESTVGLTNAATAIAMHAFPEVELAQVHQRIDELADRVRFRAPSRSPQALLAHLHDVLFEEERFAGFVGKGYRDPRNSFLPVALEVRCGLPITLCLIYKAVANCLGLKVIGVNAPYRFMVRVRSEKGWLIVDPFEGGRVYHRDEAIARIEKIVGRNRLRDDQFLPPATHRDWLNRILDNLCDTLHRDNCEYDLRAMLELKGALSQSFHSSSVA